MAYTLDPATSETLTPEHALALANEHIDHTALDSLVEQAWILRALGNNRTFLRDLLNGDIERAIDGSMTHIYTPQCVILDQDQRFTFRANFWVIPTREEVRHDLEMSLYSYEVAHDHNFNFATFGYLGPGYRTDIYEYDRSKVAGIAGEPVDLSFLETTTLEPGKLLVFRSGKDVHTQYSPPEFSISLNMICRDPRELCQPQYFFDTQESRITGHVNNAVTGRISLLRFAKYLGNEETVGLLEHVRARQDQPLLRAAIYDALLHLAGPEEQKRLSFDLAREADPLIGRRIELIREFSP